MKIRPDLVAPLKIQGVKSEPSATKGFADLMAQKIAEVDQSIVTADVKSAELIAGNGSIHETMIALEEAGIQLRMAGTVRDKVVSAYQELTRIQV
jgi:flagellar hook-basal body complex protein FliE